ncbi:MAG: 5-carboxymethyl-2-hydroxymuconate Delta-isomerase [bacterium]
MPQITLEYSKNCQHNGNFYPLFKAIHNVLQDTGGILMSNCKSRAKMLSHFYIADGDPAHAFVHLEIRFIEGRSDDIRQSIGRHCIALLKDFFQESVDNNKMQITVEIADIKRRDYSKFPHGTLTVQ